METGAIIFLSIMAVALHRNFPTSTLCIYKKRPRWGVLLFLAVQGIFYLWLMKDLRPTIRTKGLKTGKNREFLQKMAFLGKFYTTQTRTHPQISKHFHHI